MRWILGFIVLGMATASAWGVAARHGGRSAQARLVASVITYLSPVIIALLMATAVDAGWTREWSRMAKSAYVSAMMFMILFGIATLLLFLQRPVMDAPAQRRLARNCAIGSPLLTLTIAGLAQLR